MVVYVKWRIAAEPAVVRGDVADEMGRDGCRYDVTCDDTTVCADPLR